MSQLYIRIRTCIPQRRDTKWGSSEENNGKVDIVSASISASSTLNIWTFVELIQYRHYCITSANVYCLSHETKLKGDYGYFITKISLLVMFSGITSCFLLSPDFYSKWSNPVSWQNVQQICRSTLSISRVASPKYELYIKLQ